MLQADSTGRKGLKLIVRLRDFSDLQSLEFVMILTILFEKIASPSVRKNWDHNIIKYSIPE